MDGETEVLHTLQFLLGLHPDPLSRELPVSSLWRQSGPLCGQLWHCSVQPDDPMVHHLGRMAGVLRHSHPAGPVPGAANVVPIVTPLVVGFIVKDEVSFGP